MNPFCAAAYMFAFSGFMVRTMGANTPRHWLTVSMASKMAS